MSFRNFHTKISWEAKHIIFSKYTNPDIWKNLHGCLVLTFWRYETWFHFFFDIECLMWNRCVPERCGMSCLYSGHLSLSICSFVLSSNSPDLFRLFSKILPYPYITSSPFPRTPLWKQCYVSSSETLCGRFWSTLCIASCSMSTAGFQINHYSSCFISQCMEFTITFPWISMFFLRIYCWVQTNLFMLS